MNKNLGSGNVYPTTPTTADKKGILAMLLAILVVAVLGIPERKPAAAKPIAKPAVTQIATSVARGTPCKTDRDCDPEDICYYSPKSGMSYCEEAVTD